MGGRLLVKKAVCKRSMSAGKDATSLHNWVQSNQKVRLSSKQGANTYLDIRKRWVC